MTETNGINNKIRLRSVMAQSVSLGLIQTITDIYWNGALAYFYMQNLGLNVGYEAVAWIIFSVWNAVDNLIAGNTEDRSSGKLGRRLPYMRFFGPAAGVVLCLSFLKLPFVHSQLGLAISFFICICVLDFCVAFVETALFAIPYEETLDEIQRGKVFVFQGVFGMMSLLVSIVLIPAVQPDPGQDLFRFRMVMAVVAISAGFGIFLCSFFIDSTYRAEKDAIHSVSKIRFIIDCLKNRAFLVAEVYDMASQFAYSIFILGLYYYFDEICTNSIPCYIGAFSGIGVSMAVCLIFVNKIEIKTFAVATALLSGAFMLAGYLIGGTVMGGAVACFGAGIVYIGEMIFLWLMLGDCIDADEVKSGIRREGTYNGFSCVFESVANGAQPVFLAIILAYGYVEHSKIGSQSIHAQQGIMVGWLIPSAVVLILAGIVVWKFYPLDGKIVNDNKKILEERRLRKDND